MRDAVEGRSVTGGNEASGPLRRLRSGTDVFVFDLDDTLYPRSYGLHEQMRLRVVRFIQGLTGCDAEKAAALHAHYYAIYGAVIVGLVRHHGIKPVDFLDFVHDIDVTSLLPSAELATALVALPGRRLIFTNGPAWHADRVLGRLGVRALFEAVCDIEASGFVAKPAREAYDTLLSRHGIVPGRAVMFDDRIRNLEVPHLLGMQTVLIGAAGPIKAPYIDFQAAELLPFLTDANPPSA